MIIALTLETSVGVPDHKVNLIIALSNKLSEHFLNKNYGTDVQKVLIGVICVAPEFEWFSTIRKPRYKSSGKHIKDGIEITEYCFFSFEIKIDYEKFKNVSNSKSQGLLIDTLLQSLSNFDSLPKKVKDFDKEQFKKDLAAFLRNTPAIK